MLITDSVSFWEINLALPYTQTTVCPTINNLMAALCFPVITIFLETKYSDNKLWDTVNYGKIL